MTFFDPGEQTRESSFCEKKKFDVAVTRSSNQSWMGVECVSDRINTTKKEKVVKCFVNSECVLYDEITRVCRFLNRSTGERERKSFSCVKRSRYFCRVLYYIQYPVWYPIPWTPSSQVQVAILCWFIVNLSGHISNKRKELLTTFLVLVLFDRSVYWFPIDIYAICRNLISNFRGVFPRKTHTPKRWWRFD